MSAALLDLEALRRFRANSSASARRAARDTHVYAAFAVIAPLVGAIGARIFKLSTPASRAVAFSSATRNSLVVLHSRWLFRQTCVYSPHQP